MQEENAELRRKMLAMESARLEQDKKMEIVLEGIMVRLGATPLPEVVHGDDTSQGFDREQWDSTVHGCLRMRLHLTARSHQQQTAVLSRLRGR